MQIFLLFSSLISRWRKLKQPFCSMFGHVDWKLRKPRTNTSRRNQTMESWNLTISFFLFCFLELSKYYIPNVSKIAQAALTPHIKFVAGAIFSHLFFVSPNGEVLIKMSCSIFAQLKQTEHCKAETENTKYCPPHVLNNSNVLHYKSSLQYSIAHIQYICPLEKWTSHLKLEPIQFGWNYEIEIEQQESFQARKAKEAIVSEIDKTHRKKVIGTEYIYSISTICTVQILVHKMQHPQLQQTIWPLKSQSHQDNEEWDHWIVLPASRNCPEIAPSWASGGKLSVYENHSRCETRQFMWELARFYQWPKPCSAEKS